MKWLVGVDEAGRGPLAGPVMVGVAVIPLQFDWKLIPGVGDSKQVKPKDREAVFSLASDLRKLGVIDFAVAQSSAAHIDRHGIVPAIRQAMASCFKRLELVPEECEILLDGSLIAPAHFLTQKTIIKGDSLEPVIGLASIMAKVTRDRHMERVGKRPEFGPYRLEVHKGYGTKLHRELIQHHGLSAIHRQSFCRNILTRKNVV